MGKEKTEWNMEQLELFCRCPIFQGLSPEHLRDLLGDKVELRCFAREEIIYSPRHFEESLGIILSGSAVAVKNNSVLLNSFSAGNCFGVATLFSHSKCYVTTIKAKTNCHVAFFPAALMQELFRQETLISQNYISFLASRIHFLNRKIDQFTATSTEEKLVYYLLEQLENGNPISMGLSYAKLAAVLDLSRSSLYRAMDALEEANILRKEGKLLHILDVDALEQWTQHQQ